MEVNEGVYRKYKVTRTDGQSEPGEKHEFCQYFVLDLDCDEFARPAIKAYAEACAGEHPQLAADLMAWVEHGEAILLEDDSHAE